MELATIKIDEGACRRFSRSPDLVQLLEDQGQLADIVAELKKYCPKDTGKGAESIDYELDESGEFWHVTYGKKFFYLYFPEVGTEHQPARPWIRPVADRLTTR